MSNLKKIALFIGFLTIISCENTTSADVQDNVASISGKLDNSEGKELVLMRFENNKPVILDTISFSDAGEFEVKVNVKNIDFYQLAASQQNAAILILSPGESVNLTGDANNLRSGLKVSGSEHTVLLWSYYEKAQESALVSNQLRQEINALTPDQSAKKQELIDKFNESSKSFSDYTKTYIDKNSSSPAVLSALGSLRIETDFDYFVKARDGLKSTFGTTPYYKDLDKMVESYKAEQSKGKMFEPGSEVPEITQNDPDGNPRSLSSLKGKVVLIDFWASWCKPCRRENPNVVRLYNKYNKKGFDVFSVSLDKTKDKWIQAISADGLVWENHVSDLQFWNSAAAKLYNVSSIPFTVLIDEEGKVIGQKLRGAALEAKLKEIYGF